MKKKRYLAVSVTTLEALESCLENALPIICIEEPLYPSIRNDLTQLALIEDYQIQEYAHHHYIMLKKLRRLNLIDPAQSEILYHPLTY